MADTKPVLQRMTSAARKAVRWIDLRVPVGLRLPLGLLLIVLGLFGFLPVLGFWMIPLGLAIAALDAKALWRWLGGTKGDGPGKEN